MQNAWFLRVFRERIIDCWRQEWNDRIHERDRYSVNRIFKLEHSLVPVYIYIYFLFLFFLFFWRE